MRLGELLTKIAIVVTGWSFMKEHMLSTNVAAMIVVVALILSLGRDQNLRSRGIVRMMPNYGSIWLLSMALLHFTVWACGKFINFIILDPLRCTSIASLTALVYSTYGVLCETAVRKTYCMVFNCGEGELDRVQGRTYGTASYEDHEETDDWDAESYWDDEDGLDSEEESEPAVVRKKVCGQCRAIIDWESSRCWGCGEWQHNQRTIDVECVPCRRLSDGRDC